MNKTTKMMKWVMVLALAVAPMAAQAKVRVSLMGNGNLGMSSTGVSGVSNTFGIGGGALFEFIGGGKVGFELGGQYLSHAVSVASITVSTNSVLIPARANIWLGKAVALGIGGFYEVYTANSSVYDYGATGALRFALPLGSSASFLLEGGYNYGLRDGNTQNLLCLAGVTFGGRK